MNNLQFQSVEDESRGEKIFNAGMRGKKGSNYEGGHRVICFIRWPNGEFGKSRTIDYASHITDIFPTLVDMLGLDLPDNAEFDGASLKDVLLDENISLQARKIIVQFGGRIRPQKYEKSCVIWNNWRLIGEGKLYDLEKDPGQRTNVAVQNPEVLRTLKAYYDDYWASIESSIEVVEPLLVRSSPQEFTNLTSNSWIEVDCDNRDRVAATCEPARGGVWSIEVEQSGTYSVRISRWPFHLERALTRKGPAATISGMEIDQGKALTITSGELSVNGGQPLEAVTGEKDVSIEFEISLEQGLHTVQGWFKDVSGRDLTGAYYGRIQAK